ncbi:MAG: GAF domain-containing protein [Gemmatimonadota bacterium]
MREGLKDLAEELSFITDLDRMENLLLRRLTDLAHVARAAIFLREEGGDGYVLSDWVEQTRRDGARGPLPVFPEDGRPRFDANDSFVIWLLRAARPLSLETLAEADFHQRVETREVEILRRLDAALCLPLRIRGDMIGFILLSRRLNRELFNRDEIELLHGLAMKAATDLTNARLQTRSRRLEEELISLREEVLGSLRAFLAAPPEARWVPAAEHTGALMQRLEAAAHEPRLRTERSA